MHIYTTLTNSNDCAYCKLNKVLACTMATYTDVTIDLYQESNTTIIYAHVVDMCKVAPTSKASIAHCKNYRKNY